MAVEAADIKGMSESFADVDNAVITSAITDATLHVNAWFSDIAAVFDEDEDVYTDDLEVEWTEAEKEYLIRLHVAHDLATSGESPTLESESIGDISTGIAVSTSPGDGWNGSQWGRKMVDFVHIKRGDAVQLARA